jgi:hypothetical protein
MSTRAHKQYGAGGDGGKFYTASERAKGSTLTQVRLERSGCSIPWDHRLWNDHPVHVLHLTMNFA